jgi:hypothetical protein
VGWVLIVLTPERKASFGRRLETPMDDRRLGEVKQYARRLFAGTVIDADRVAEIAIRAEGSGVYDAFDVVVTICDIYAPALAAGLDRIVMAQKRLYVEAKQAADG